MVISDVSQQKGSDHMAQDTARPRYCGTSAGLTRMVRCSPTSGLIMPAMHKNIPTRIIPENQKAQLSSKEIPTGQVPLSIEQTKSLSTHIPTANDMV